MKNTKFLWYFMMFAFLFFAACSDDDEPEPDPPTPINEAEVLVNYLESTDSPYGKDYVNTDLGNYISATDVHTDIVAGTDIYLIDIRSAEAHDTARIAGSVNLAAGDVLTHVQDEGLGLGDKIVIICYTGQTAGWTVSILRLNGYTNVWSMKWGMCSWHEDFAGKWQSNISNGYSAFFEDDDVPKGETGDLPDLNTGEETGEAIFAARVAVVTAEGFGAAKFSDRDDIISNPDDYYVINYWGYDDYDNYGHLPGAMQYTPKESIALDVDLTTLPTDKTIIVYCWTGQTSAHLSAYLRILGYDAKSLLFGANAMIYDELTGHKWVDTHIMGYDYEEVK